MAGNAFRNLADYRGYRLPHLLEVVDILPAGLLPKTEAVLDEKIARALREFPLERLAELSDYSIDQIRSSLESEVTRIKWEIRQKGFTKEEKQ